MRERIIWILIAVMAAAFLYLKVKGAVVDEPVQEVGIVESAPSAMPIETHNPPHSALSSWPKGQPSLTFPPKADPPRAEREGDRSAPPLKIRGGGGSYDNQDNRILRIGSTQITIEIADTDAARSQGLSGRESLPENQGMLFIMDQPGIHHFWMKDMRFSLDIIWIRDGRVVDISENVPAPAEGEAPMVVSPSELADQVLEVNAGFARKNGLKIGDQVEI